ncbi:hypothetical protein HAX54_002214 [Datura stramonium]|uniref:NYN domain-containing protein n=1 Tax=Datura stramonium TaxID=4076 RepID=A0ABS8RSX8_DATST|nr:hypothetical protein [Datura stramonium]
MICGCSSPGMKCLCGQKLPRSIIDLPAEFAPFLRANEELPSVVEQGLTNEFSGFLTETRISISTLQLIDSFVFRLPGTTQSLVETSDGRLQGCQRTGVKLIDVPNGRKDAADKAILVDMLFALTILHPSIMLISGDVDFAPGVGVSSALCNAEVCMGLGYVARGEGFVPPAKALIPCRGGVSDIVGF